MSATMDSAVSLKEGAERQHPLKFLIKAIWFTIFLMVAMRALFDFIGSRYEIMIDTQEIRCIPEYSVYLVSKKNWSLERGKIYAYRAEGLEPYFEDGAVMGKYATAIPGDTVEVTPAGVFVNGEKQTSVVGFELAETLNIPVEHFYRKTTNANDEIFFTGTGARSYDSRYWGPAKTEQIIGEAIPLW